MKLSFHCFFAVAAISLATAFQSNAGPAGTPVSGTLFYTRYQGPSEIKKVQFSYDGATNFSFSNSVSITQLPGADGLTVAPDGSLIVGSCGNLSISKVDPNNGSRISFPSGGGACHIFGNDQLACSCFEGRQRRRQGWSGAGRAGRGAVPMVRLAAGGAGGSEVAAAGA